MPRQPGQMLPENLVAQSINDRTLCETPDAELEVTSNSIAADENGGIYVVTSKAMYRFMVFTDGQELMHLVLMWRDGVPADWEPIAEGRGPRIACEIPITFGDDSAKASLSEQSVLVRGYASVPMARSIKEPGPA